MAQVQTPPDAPASGSTAESLTESLLDWLQAHGYLSDARFAESRVHTRSSRFGNLRIRQELKQHGVALDEQAALALRATELERACAVRERKFPNPATDAASRAKQARFLAGRGFSPEVIQRALRLATLPQDAGDDDSDAPV